MPQDLYYNMKKTQLIVLCWKHTQFVATRRLAAAKSVNMGYFTVTRYLKPWAWNNVLFPPNMKVVFYDMPACFRVTESIV